MEERTKDARSAAAGVARRFRAIQPSFLRAGKFIAAGFAAGSNDDPEGKKTMAKRLVWFLAVGAVSFAIISCGILPAKKHSSGYTLSSREAKVIAAVLENDPEMFISQKGRSIIGHDIRSVPSAYIAREYDLDPDKAEQKYAGNIFRVTGKVEAVHVNDDDPPYMILEGTNFSSPHVFFGLSDAAKAAAIGKDETVTLICECEGAVASSPVFANCQFSEDFVLRRVHEVRKDMEDFLRGAQTVFPGTGETVVYLMAYARLLPNQSPCFSKTEFSECNIADLLSLPLTSESRFHDTVEKVKKDLRDRGVGVP
jgi:hypothetical protein